MKDLNIRINKIWELLSIELHQEFTLRYVDSLVSYFESFENITYDDILYKLKEIESLIIIINPEYKEDLIIFQKIKKELDSWKRVVNVLNNCLMVR